MNLVDFGVDLQQVQQLVERWDMQLEDHIQRVVIIQVVEFIQVQMIVMIPVREQPLDMQQQERDKLLPKKPFIDVY